MAYPVTLNGRTYTLADFEGTNYVDGLPDAFEDFVTHAGSIYKTTSTTSNTIGTGSKSFTTADNSLPYQVGTPLRISDGAAPATNWMDGIVTAYSGTSLTVNVVSYAGSGTLTDWDINIGGGGTSYTGTLPIAQGGTGATTAGDARTNIDVYSKSEADSRFLNVAGEASAVTITGNLSVDGGTIKLDGNYPVATGNVALGNNALSSNVSGNYNIAIGSENLTSSTSSGNTSVGYQTGYSQVGGAYSTYVGMQAGYSNVSENYNTGIGYGALIFATGYENTAVGANAGRGNSTGTISGYANVSIGHNSMYYYSTGYANVAVGQSALQNLTTGYNNTGIGKNTLDALTTGTGNVSVGNNAGTAAITASSTTYIGEGAGASATASSNTFVGRDAGYLVTSGGDNTILGRYSGNQGGLDIRTTSNNIVLSDGDGDPLLYYHGGLSSPAWFMRNPSSGQWISQFSNESTNPYGLFVYYTAASPNGSSNYFVYLTDNTTVRLYVRSNGDVLNQNNTYGALSDEKLKENIVDSDSQWDDIKALRVRKYSLKTDELDAPNKLGVIAQEVEAAGMGGLVDETTDQDEDLNDLGTTTKTVKYSILYMKAVKALQEAMERIETLEAKVAALEAN